MYESPIDIIYSEMQTKLEGEVFKAVQNVGINVNKDELIKALSYDRHQYEKGYADAKAEQQWIPVSSGKLPEMNKPVLVTHNGKYQAFVSVDWIDPYTTEWNRTCNVTAWCPLPEPFREGGAEECH